MKPVFLFLLSAVLVSCGNIKAPQPRDEYRVLFILPHTPVKNQGTLNSCWAYAMLSLIESDRLAMGDSVNLSGKYVARSAAEEAFERSLRTGEPFSIRGTGFTLLHFLEKNGVLNYDAYPDTLMPPARHLEADLSNLARRKGSKTDGTSLMDNALGFPPRYAFLYAATYKPTDLAHSVCLPGDYVGLMSDARFPFGKKVVLPVPDNREKGKCLNLSIDALMDTLNATLTAGHTVAWEGDVSEPTFSYAHGLATWPVTLRPTNQRERQRGIESGNTQDNHVMHIIGMAENQRGEIFYICKNSFGSRTPRHGYFLMSANYLRMKTLALFKHR